MYRLYSIHCVRLQEPQRYPNYLPLVAALLGNLRRD